ncbi:MAG: hypothetical protein ACI959_002303 [Limisphaerales bacterium]|jgi:hypothetical protein
MKKNYITSSLTFAFSTFFALSIGLLFMSSSAGRAGSANDGNVGAPGEGANVCGSCHTGGSFGTITETLTIADMATLETVTEYVPGTTYKVSIEVKEGGGNPQGYGFQMTALDGSDNEVNDWANPSGNAQIETASLVGGRTYVEHNDASLTGVFDFDWSAPAAGTGDVIFYFAGNVINGNNMTSGDVGGMGSTLSLPEASGSGITAINSLEVTAFPNPLTGNQVRVNIGNLPSNSNAVAKLYDLTGKLIHAELVNSAIQTLDFSELNSGNYILNITADELNFTGKLMKL